MSGFEALPQALDPGLSRPAQTAEEIKFANEKLADEIALGVVLADTTSAEQYVQSKALPTAWNTADELFRAQVTPQKWDGSDKLRSHLGMPLVMEVVEDLLPQTHLAFFSDPKPFNLVAKGRTSPAAATAASHVVEWAVNESGFKEQIRLMEKDCLLYGTCVGKWGWKTGTKTSKIYSRHEETGVVQSESKPKSYSCPTFDHVDLENLLVDSHTRTMDIRDSRFAIYRKFITFEELDGMRGDYNNVPTRAQLKNIMAEMSAPTENSLPGMQSQTWRQYQAEWMIKQTTSDQTKHLLEVLEYWTGDKVITVLQRCIVLRNEENEFGRLPFVSCSFVDVPKSFYGFGVAKLLDGEQRFEQGVVNAWVDALSLYLSPVWVRKGGIGASNQSIAYAPGRVINDAGELEPLKKESISMEAMQAISTSENRARRRVGANFGSDMPTQALRTAEGVQEFTSSLQTKLQYFVENFAENVFVPVLESFLEMSKDLLSPAQINSILTDKDGKTFNGEILEVYNGNYSIQVLTSTKLAARRAMAGMLPSLFQMFMVGPVQDSLTQQNKKVDFSRLLEEALDIAGWDADNIIVDMTPQDTQRAMQSNQAYVKAQAEAQLEDKEHQNDMDLEAQKGDVRAGVTILKHTLDQSAVDPLATRQKDK